MASKLLKGYKRLPGRPRRYLTPSGKQITEYEYRSRKARRQKDRSGKPIFSNYSQERRFRESQEFLRLRFNIRSIDSQVLVDTGSDLEAAIAEFQQHPKFGQSGIMPEPEGRLAELLDAIGAPEYYFWRYWYSETRVG